MSNIYSVARRMSSKALKKYGATWQLGKRANTGTEERPVMGEPKFKPFSGIYEEKRRMSQDGLRVDNRATVVIEAGSSAEIGDIAISPKGKRYTVDDISPVQPGAMEVMVRLWLA